MVAIRPTLLCISIALSSSACAQKDAAFERGMREWADKTCSCLMLPRNEASECRAKLPEPPFPSHWADAMMDNPNYAVADPFRQQVIGCEKAFAARDQQSGL